MTPVTKEMAEAALTHIENSLIYCASVAPVGKGADGEAYRNLRTYITTLEAENAALREQVKALKGGV